jgi:hypothetical protein
VFAHSRFIENHPVWILEDGPLISEVVLSHQPKWRVKSVSPSSTDPWVSLSDHTGEEEVTHPIGRDRAKAVVQKGKAKEG